MNRLAKYPRTLLNICDKKMKVFNIVIPKNDPLTNYEIWKYARKLGIPHFRTVCMLNTLPTAVKSNECGIVNLNKSGEK